MRSFTSSFDSTTIGLLKQGTVPGIAMALVLLFSFEAVLRQMDITPMTRDTRELWALTRSQVSGNRDSVALLGSSKVLAGIDREAFAEGAGHRKKNVHQLAVLGGSSFAQLREVAEDEAFIGTAIVGVMPAAFFGAAQDPLRAKKGWAPRWRETTPAQWSEHFLSREMQAKLGVRRRGFDFQSIAQAVLSRRQPEALFQKFNRDRSFRMRLSEYPPSALRKHQRSEASKAERFRAVPPDKLVPFISEVAELTARIRARGGAVIFVRMPSSGPVLAAETILYPAGTHWDVLIRETEAIGVDVATLPPGMECPDYVHLDSKHVPAFSRMLGADISALASRHLGEL